MTDTHERHVIEQPAGDDSSASSPESPASDDGCEPTKADNYGPIGERPIAIPDCDLGLVTETVTEKKVGKEKKEKVVKPKIVKTDTKPMKTEEGTKEVKPKKERTEKQLNALKEANAKKSRAKEEKINMLKRAEALLVKEEELKVKEARKAELLALLSEVKKEKAKPRKRGRKKEEPEPEEEDDEAEDDNDDDTEDDEPPKKKAKAEKKPPVPKTPAVKQKAVEMPEASKPVKPAVSYQKSKPIATFNYENAPQRMHKLYTDIFT